MPRSTAFVVSRRNEVDAQLPVQSFAQILGRQEQFGHRQDRPLDVVCTLFVAFLGLPRKQLGGIRRTANDEQCLLGEILEQGLGGTRSLPSKNNGR